MFAQPKWHLLRLKIHREGRDQVVGKSSIWMPHLDNCVKVIYFRVKGNPGWFRSCLKVLTTSLQEVHNVLPLSHKKGLLDHDN
jgi:hypothetical protein